MEKVIDRLEERLARTGEGAAAVALASDVEKVRRRQLGRGKVAKIPQLAQAAAAAAIVVVARFFFHRL